MIVAAGVPGAAADHRAGHLVQDAQDAHAERDDAEARREGHRAAGRGDAGDRRRPAGRRRSRRAAPTAPLYEQAQAAAQARRVVRPAQGRDHGRDRPRPHVLLDARRRLAQRRSAWCCCSSASATSCSGGSRTGSSPRTAAARHRPVRPAPEPTRDRSAAARGAGRPRSRARWRRRRSPMPQLIARVVVDDDRHAFAELVRRHQSAVRAMPAQADRGQSRARRRPRAGDLRARLAQPEVVPAGGAVLDLAATGSRPTAGSPTRASARRSCSATATTTSPTTTTTAIAAGDGARRRPRARRDAQARPGARDGRAVRGRAGGDRPVLP